MKMEMRDVCQNYGTKEILHGITATAKTGKVVSLLGPNGSGKSTLIKTISGLMPCFSGSVLYGDSELSELLPEDRAKLISYVPQNFTYMPFTKVADAVMVGRTPHLSWEPSDEDFEIVQQCLGFMGVEDLAESYVNQLSGGQMQRVFVARALAQKTKFLIFDEPTSSLDIKFQLKTMKKISELVHSEKICLFMAMHDLNLALKYSDEVILLKEGRIHSVGKPFEVVTEENLEEVYGVNSEIVDGKGGKYVHVIDA